MENPENIQYVCSKHAPKAKGQYKGLGKLLVGKFVKLGFPVRNPSTGHKTVEHMWVKVSSYTKGRYRGVLDNVPTFECSVGYRDEVTFTAKRIEAVYNEGSS